MPLVSHHRLKLDMLGSCIRGRDDLVVQTGEVIDALLFVLGLRRIKYHRDDQRSLTKGQTALRMRITSYRCQFKSDTAFSLVRCLIK